VLEFLVCEINSLAMSADVKNTEEHHIIRIMHMHNMLTMHIVLPECGTLLPKHAVASSLISMCI
jgi:hypothetical protein